MGFAIAGLGLDLAFSWLVAGMAGAAGPEGVEMAFRLVWTPAIPLLVAFVVLAVAAWMDRGWSPLVLVAGGVWSAWSGVGALATMGGFPSADLLGVLAFSLAISEIGLAGAAALFAWVRTRRAMAAMLLLALMLGAAPLRAAEPAPEPWRAAVDAARAEAERARVEADRARAEADRARAEADRARAEADRALAELARMRSEGPVLVPMVPVEPVVRGPRPGDFAHDGMFLRLTVGVGYAGYAGHGTADSPNTPAQVADPSDHGLSGGFAFSLGASVRPNLALHGTIAFLGDTPSSGDRVFLEGANVLVGGGVTWYAMPWNVYLTGGGGLATYGFVIHDRRAGYEARDDAPRWAYGPGVFAAVGKEWWTGPTWSLGVALEGNYARTYGDDLTFDHAGGRLVFSATFN